MSETPVLIHLHVPKCAGSSINRALRHHFRPRYFGLTMDRKVRERYLRMTPESRDESFDAVFGHLHFGEHRFFTRPCVYISVTRDPIDRICSFYNFLHTHPDHAKHKHIKSTLCDLNDFSEENLEDPTLKRLWADAFLRVYGGSPQAPNLDFKKVRVRLIHQLRNKRLLAGPLPVIEEFLRQIGISQIPKLNVSEIGTERDFEPASPATLNPGVRLLLKDTFCRKDYDLLDAIESERPLSGSEFAMEVGLGESWLAE